jgi:hypothetical protein
VYFTLVESTARFMEDETPIAKKMFNQNYRHLIIIHILSQNYNSFPIVLLKLVILEVIATSRYFYI